jgi:hypothetical protein
MFLGTKSVIWDVVLRTIKVFMSVKLKSNFHNFASESSVCSAY